MLRLPDPEPVTPPKVPKTPLYPRLHTNTPVPIMTYPGFPFPNGTALYPTHEHIQLYHRSYAEHYNLLPHIHFRHQVRRASWVGNEKTGYWEVEIILPDGALSTRTFKHLVIGSGNHHLPRIPSWPGERDWLASRRSRRITHAVWYRNPEDYNGLRVLIVGNGSSGRDIAAQIAEYAKEVTLLYGECGTR